MPRANRFQQPEMICHLTHRCHDQAFLLRFARDRSEYRERLRQAVKQFGVSLLGYSVTSSHCHEIAIESKEGGISRMMQKTEGEFAISYNRRKNRSGAYWEDRYHCTMVEDGEHLWNCMQYVDLNMVRAGVVAHPSEWQWCGYSELIGEKKHYRLLDVERILELLGQPDIESFRAEYRSRIQCAIENRRLSREKKWTESIAVGRKEYVERMAAVIRRERLKPRLEEEDDGSWAVWESASDYQPLCNSRLAHIRVFNKEIGPPKGDQRPFQALFFTLIIEKNHFTSVRPRIFRILLWR
jgi:putative transposase